jgi:hypothetical protein
MGSSMIPTTPPGKERAAYTGTGGKISLALNHEVLYNLLYGLAQTTKMSHGKPSSGKNGGDLPNLGGELCH